MKEYYSLISINLFFIVVAVTVELSAVTDDNRILKQRIQILESELKK